MDDEKQRQIFSKALRDLIYKSGKQQKEVAKALNIKATTFNSWCTGKIMPRMGKIQMLADYFGVPKTALTDEQTDHIILSEKETTIIKTYREDPISREAINRIVFYKGG